MTNNEIKNLCINAAKLYYDYLEENNYIKIEKKTEKFHIVKLNEEEIPDLKIFREIIQKYWISPEEEKAKANKWSKKA